MKKEFFGTLPTGENVHSYSIKGKNTNAAIIDYGATVNSFVAFGKDIIGGFDTIDPYLENPGCQGNTIGRVSNRIKNSRFTIDGVEYKVVTNNNSHCLHGGMFFNHTVWNVVAHSESSITLTYTSPDGEGGFPGELKATVTYSIIDDALAIDYKAIADKKTPIGLTNHSYFNLDGFGGDIKEHKLKIFAKTYTEADSEIVPTGNHPDVVGTPFDFSELRRIGDGMENGLSGYDHNFVLSPEVYADYLGKNLGLAAIVENGSLRLSVYTDQPGVQLYTGNGLAGNADFKGGVKAVKYGGLCLETQNEPNSVNRGIGIYDAGEEYTHTCVYKVERK